MTLLTQPGPYTSSTLWNGLSVGYHLDEASGVALDFGSNAQHLTDNNTVGAAAGQVGGARLFVAAQNESHSRASSAAFQTGDIDFTIAGGVYFDALTASGACLWAKWGSGESEYACDYDGTSRLRFYVSSTGSNAVIVVANALGQPSTATWYHVACWHDSIGNSINIQVNNGTINTTAHSAGVRAGGASFRLGARLPDEYLSGRLDEVVLWKRLLTPAERAENYANWLAGRSF